MIKNREGNLVSETHRQCTNCRKIFEKTSNTVTLCKECNCKRVKSLSLETKIRNRAQQRARNNNLPFNLEKEDIIIPEKCPVFGVPLVVHSGSPGGKKFSPSIDRIIPELGYVKGNVRVISHLANQMKSHATQEELLTFANWVINHYKSLGKD